jgi:MoxR-like ATPase
MCRGDTGNRFAIQISMKQPSDQEERNQDKKKPENENPSHGIDPESKEPEMEVERKLANG